MIDIPTFFTEQLRLNPGRDQLADLGPVDEIWEEQGDVRLRAPLVSMWPGNIAKSMLLRFRAYGPEILRVSMTEDSATGEPVLPTDEGPILQPEDDLVPTPLVLRSASGIFEMVDARGNVRARIEAPTVPDKPWSTLVDAPAPKLRLTLLPDGRTALPVSWADHFFPKQCDGVGLGTAGSEDGRRFMLLGLQVAPQECFCGTGERFAKMDLSGQALTLMNVDGLGVNSRRTYKNVPFVLSNRPYGLFVHSSEIIELSLAAHSTRTLQVAVPGDSLDVFVIGGGSPSTILARYQQLVGRPKALPQWSYGTWMSRMTYFSGAEVGEIAARLRKESLPCDVLHLDTGWFQTDWVCEWKFGQQFPNPKGFMQDLLEKGFRTTLWQNPNMGKGNELLEEALNKRILPPPKSSLVLGSEFSDQDLVGQIDFTNPEAVAWYQAKLRELLEMGAAAIKTDFGECINMQADYQGMPARSLRNLYGLLYQKAAAEVTDAVHGYTLIWARAGWAGCQRYPLHWGGDAACTWDGMAASLRGGLHLGISGFLFWSHDVPGFHGVPDFMNSRPSDTLYVRWTQFGVLSSHLRYHGTSEREPWHYPAVIDVVRKWLHLRYALIPYLTQEADHAIATGLPMLRALLLACPKDPVVWHCDDQYFLGRDLLVAPVMNDHGVRDVYLPEGNWLDFWTGKKMEGHGWLRDVHTPLEGLPLFVREGARIPFYPDKVQHTGEMLASRVFVHTFDAGAGFLDINRLKWIGFAEPDPTDPGEPVHERQTVHGRHRNGSAETVLTEYSNHSAGNGRAF